MTFFTLGSREDFGKTRGPLHPPLLHTTLRVTSHTRLTTRDHYTSSTLIGRKGGGGPSSLHTTLEGPTQYVKCFMFHGLLNYFPKTFLKVGLTQNRETMALRVLTNVGVF